MKIAFQTWIVLYFVNYSTSISAPSSLSNSRLKNRHIRGLGGPSKPEGPSPAAKKFFANPGQFMSENVVHTYYMDKHKPQTGKIRFDLKHEEGTGYGVVPSKNGIKALWVNTKDTLDVKRPVEGKKKKMILTPMFSGCTFRAGVDCKGNMKVFHQYGVGTSEKADNELKGTKNKFFLKGDALRYSDYGVPDSKYGKSNTGQGYEAMSVIKNNGDGKWNFHTQGQIRNLHKLPEGKRPSELKFSEINSIKLDKDRPYQKKPLSKTYDQMKLHPNKIHLPPQLPKPAYIKPKSTLPFDSKAYTPIKLSPNKWGPKPPKPVYRRPSVSRPSG